MSDVVDRANDLAERQREEALAAHEARVAAAHRPRDPVADSVCMDCNGQIEQERLHALPLTNRCAVCAHIAAEIYRNQAWMP